MCNGVSWVASSIVLWYILWDMMTFSNYKMTLYMMLRYTILYYFMLLTNSHFKRIFENRRLCLDRGKKERANFDTLNPNLNTMRLEMHKKSDFWGWRGIAKWLERLFVIPWSEGGFPPPNMCRRQWPACLRAPRSASWPASTQDSSCNFSSLSLYWATRSTEMA